jgi:hypothetical protein
MKIFIIISELKINLNLNLNTSSLQLMNELHGDVFM